jgi:sugar/nucleoside kinase (ribokinase family)
MESGGLIVTIGDLVEDIVVWPQRPIAQGTDNPSTVTRCRGGSAANAAAFAATLGPSRFVGRVGNDASGRALTADLEAQGVQVRVQREGRTGTIVICVSEDGERTMFPDRAAAAELSDVPGDWVSGATTVLVSLYALARPASAATTLSLVAAAKRAGATVAVDLSSIDLMAHLGVATVVDLLGRMGPSVCFANHDEAKLLPKSAVIRIGSRFVVKNGAGPVVVHGLNGSRLLVPVDPVQDVQDTTGAGDAFAAGYLSADQQGMNPFDAAVFGSRLAARVLQSPGATLRVPASLDALPG